MLQGSRRRLLRLVARDRVRKPVDQIKEFRLDHATISLLVVTDDGGQRRVEILAPACGHHEAVHRVQRRIVPSRRVQGGGLGHRCLAVRDRASGELVALACGRQIFENQREVVGRRIDFGEDRPRRVDGDGRRQLAIERDLANIKHVRGTGAAAVGICGREFADDA